MEEDVKPEDEDGVDGQGVCGWDGWVCGLGVVVLVSNMSFAQDNRGFTTSFNATSSFRRDTIVGGALPRTSDFRVGLGVSGVAIVSGSCACPSHLWMSLVLTSSSSTLPFSLSSHRLIHKFSIYLSFSPFIINKISFVFSSRFLDS